MTTRWAGGALLFCALLACQAADSVSPPTPRPSPRSQPEIPRTIVLLGDSLAFGAGDETGQGIAGRLEGEFRARSLPAITTTNLGVNGAGTADLMTRLKQERTRILIAGADAIVLSVGANDLFRTPNAREEAMRAPLVVAERILERIVALVGELQRINPEARILILGGYNPVPRHPDAQTIERYLGLWDAALAAQFEDDPRVEVVKMSDVVTPQRLSRLDSFHPGSAAYAEAAKRIASILLPA